MTTPEQNAQQIAANTEAIAANIEALNFLVTEFIRPNAQQHLQSLERLDRIEGIVEAVAQQQQANTEAIASNAQQIAANTEAMTAFDARLEETRALVAENSSGIAQLKVLQTQNAQQIADLVINQDRNSDLTERNGQQIEALAELTRSQLAGIIGNGRRIDRLEQQAS